jgi:SAM-dependent methyltransferase
MLMILSKLTGESMLRMEGVIEEYVFWESLLSGTNKLCGIEGERFETDAEIIEPHRSVLEELGQHFPIQDIAILDVGAGPLTVIRKIYKGIRLNITAVDALADYYDNLLKKYGVDPPVRTQQCKGEDITQHFPTESFHWINSRNALDHMERPVECIKGMLTLLKPGGMISLFHHLNEGADANYAGFHQWNFFLEDDDFCIAGKNGKDHVNVTKMLLPHYTTSTRVGGWLDSLDPRQDCLQVIVRCAKK